MKKLPWPGRQGWHSWGQNDVLHAPHGDPKWQISTRRKEGCQGVVLNMTKPWSKTLQIVLSWSHKSYWFYNCAIWTYALYILLVWATQFFDLNQCIHNYKKEHKLAHTFKWDYLLTFVDYPFTKSTTGLLYKVSMPNLVSILNGYLYLNVCGHGWVQDDMCSKGIGLHA